MKRKFEMKTKYIQPEIEISVIALGTSILQASDPVTIQDNGEIDNGDGQDADINTIHLWDDKNNY